MSLPRRHIAEGIARALVAGLEDPHAFVLIQPSDHWKRGEPHAFVACRDLRDPTLDDLREALS